MLYKVVLSRAAVRYSFCLFFHVQDQWNSRWYLPFHSCFQGFKKRGALKVFLPDKRRYGMLPLVGHRLESPLFVDWCRVLQRLVGNPVLQGTKTSKLLGYYEKLNSSNFRVITVVSNAVFLLSNGLVLCFLFPSYRRLLLSRNSDFFFYSVEGYSEVWICKGYFL